MQPRQSDTLSPREAADVLKRAVVTLERWRRQRSGPPFYRIQNRVIYRASDIEAWLESSRVAA